MEEKYGFLKSVPMNYVDEQRKVVLKTESLKAYILRKDFDIIVSP